MDYYFISDPHFGHRNVLGFESRPFESVEEMDQAIIDNVNHTIKSNDIVFWLGDMFFSKSARREEIATQLTAKGRHIVILGNHDRGRVSIGQFLRLGFNPVKMHKFNEFILTHEPLSLTNLLYLQDQGIRANVHGHLHHRDEGLDPNLYCCVSVEHTNYKPIAYEEVRMRLLRN
jgi:calcineurin-like phosphoesterase family protein